MVKVSLSSISSHVFKHVAEIFLFSGTSALLISVSHFYPELRYISLFALIPFLWKATRSTLREAAFLGILLSASYCFVTLPFSSCIIFETILSRLLILGVVFAAYGIAVNRLVKHAGFNIVLIAVLWLPVEYVLNEYAPFHGFLILPYSDFTIRIGSLFGMLILSFIVALSNVLLVQILDHTLQLCAKRRFVSTGNSYKFIPINEYVPLLIGIYLIPNRRAPPLEKNCR